MFERRTLIEVHENTHIKQVEVVTLLLWTIDQNCLHNHHLSLSFLGLFTHTRYANGERLKWTTWHSLYLKSDSAKIRCPSFTLLEK
jgi:hypothetical protein